MEPRSSSARGRAGRAIGAVAGFIAGVCIGAPMACVAGGRFECEDDERCIDGDRQGVCEASGYCSFADPTCDSGARYSRFAPPSLAERCTPVGGATDTPGTSGASTTDGGGSSDDGTDTGPPPDLGPPAVRPPREIVCGDGWHADGEACDDGNAIDGDGCNHDCVISGTPLWTTLVNGTAGGDDLAGGLALMPSGHIVATGRSSGDGGDVWMARFDPDSGEVLRTWQYGTAEFEEGLAIAVDEASQIYVVGTLTGATNLRNIFVRVYYDELFEGGVPDGNVVNVWNRTLSSAMAADDAGRAVALRPSRDQVVVGGLFGDVDSPSHPSTHARGFPTTGGTAVWTSGGGVDSLGNEANALVVDAAGRVFLGGSVRTSNGNMLTDAWLGELDLTERDGTVGYRWTRRIGEGALREVIYAVALRPGGDLLVAGAQGGHAFWGVWTPDGDEIARVVADDPDASAIRAIAADATGAVVTVGEHATAAGLLDIEVIKTAPDGSLAWRDVFDGEAHADDHGRAVVIAPDGTIVAAGHARAPASDNDVWLRKYAP